MYDKASSDALIINDCKIISESGRSAILDGTAQDVQAVKTVYSEELQTDVEVIASGNLISVLDRVNDLFFGLADTYVYLSDPAVVKFLDTMKNLPEQKKIEHKLTLQFKSDNQSAQGRRLEEDMEKNNIMINISW